jgi:hemerythrin HHE cation binding domain-containing protein
VVGPGEVVPVDGRIEDVALTGPTDALVHRFAAEHDQLGDAFPLLRRAAALLAAGPTDEALDSVRRAHAFLTDRVLPHEHAEDTQLYPALATPLGGQEATAPMSRTHAEIQRLSDRIGTHLDLAAAGGGLDVDQVEDLLASLYGLYAVLRLHFAQEEENYFTLSEAASHPAPGDTATPWRQAEAGSSREPRKIQG